MTQPVCENINKPVSICCSPEGKMYMLDTDGNIWEWNILCQGWWCVIDKSKTLKSINT